MKVYEASQKQQPKDFEENLSFAECLDYFSKEPISDELNEMEKSMSKSRFKIHSLNNTHHQPL